jgi:ABC-type lipoprotein release transport system permease subunit
MLFTLAWRNLWRNKNRTFITMASISSAVLLSVTLVSLQRGIFDNLIRNVVSFYTGYVQIHGKGYWKDQTLENCLPLTDSLLQSVLATPGVASVTPRLEAFSLASFGETTKGCMVVGIDPEAENRITHLKDKLISGEYPGKDGSGLMVAEGLANSMGVRTGDTLVLLGQSMYGSTAAGKFAITGILRFGSPDLNRRLVYLDIGTARLMFDTGERVTSLVVSPTDETRFRLLASTLQTTFQENADVMTWEDKMPDIVQHIETDTASMYIISGVLYLLISFGIFSTLLMMLAERRREFGMLVALGMKRGLLARLAVVESVLVAFLGAIAGVLISFPVVWYLEKNPIKAWGALRETFEQFGFEAIFPTVVQADIFISQTAIVLTLALVLAVYPAWHIMRLNTVQAIRS